MIDQLTRAADVTRKSEAEVSITFAVAAGVFGVLSVLVWLLVGTIFLEWEWVKIGLAVLVLLVGFVVGGMLSSGYVMGVIRAGKILGKIYKDEEKQPAPEIAPIVISTPALPEVKESAKDETPDLSRGGDTSRKLHGLPALTVEYMCNYLGNKNSWAEGRLEKMPVPYVYPPARFGKAEKNSIYNQLFHPERGIFCRAGIIDERGGPGNDKGKLLVSNPVEMMERIKQLAEAESVTENA